MDSIAGPYLLSRLSIIVTSPYRFILALLAALFISGCASMPETRLPVPKGPDEGAVIVRFLPNTESASQFMKNWHELIVEQEGGAERGPQFAIRPDLLASSRSATYVGALPPGRYRFVRFSSQSCGAICISANITVGEKFSRFEVQPQRLTDLGVIVQTPSPRERSVLLAHVASDDQALVDELVRETAPALTPMLGKPKLGWREDSVPKLMPELATYAKLASHGFVQPNEVAGGQVIFGTANGALGSWKPGQEREGQFDLGTNRSVEAVLVTAGGAWLAGGELSLLMQSDDQGRSWRSIRGKLPLGLVLDLHEWKGKVLLTMLSKEQVLVFSAPVGSADWRQLGRYQTDVSVFWDIPGVRPRSLLMDDYLVTTIPARKMVVNDLAAGTAEERELPGGVQIISASEDKVLRCRCVRGIAVNPWESSDMGKTWNPATLSRWIQQPVFRDRQHGVAFEGAVFSSAKLVRTVDGGKTWTPSMDLNFPITSMFYSRDRKAVYAATPYGSVWGSEDDGQTWKQMR